MASTKERDARSWSAIGVRSRMARSAAGGSLEGRAGQPGVWTSPTSLAIRDVAGCSVLAEGDADPSSAPHAGDGARWSGGGDAAPSEGECAPAEAAPTAEEAPEEAPLPNRPRPLPSDAQSEGRSSTAGRRAVPSAGGARLAGEPAWEPTEESGEETSARLARRWPRRARRGEETSARLARCWSQGEGEGEACSVEAEERRRRGRGETEAAASSAAAEAGEAPGDSESSAEVAWARGSAGSGTAESKWAGEVSRWPSGFPRCASFRCAASLRRERP